MNDFCEYLVAGAIYVHRREISWLMGEPYRNETLNRDWTRIAALGITDEEKFPC